MIKLLPQDLWLVLLAQLKRADHQADLDKRLSDEAINPAELHRRLQEIELAQEKIRAISLLYRNRLF